MFNLLCNGGFFLFCSRSKLCNSTNDSSVTRRNDNSLSISFAAKSTIESNVCGFKRSLAFGICLWETFLRFWLSSHRGIIDFEGLCLKHPDVSWNLLTVLDLNDIANDDISCWKIGDFLSFTGNNGRCWCQLLKTLHDRISLCILVEGETSGKEYDDGQDNTKIKVVNGIVVDSIRNETQNCSSPQEKGEKSSHMKKELDIPWKGRRGGEFIESITFKTPLCFRSAKTILDTGIVFRRNFFTGHHMLIHRNFLSSLFFLFTST
mmetsp:Transcript_26969/g.37367  ORF Transcript_26969/g.37367 Transcript_26969/m.37367 type:complete len:263 (-) Transcript_26969:244-1032(-)